MTGEGKLGGMRLNARRAGDRRNAVVFSAQCSAKNQTVYYLVKCGLLTAPDS